MPRTCQITGKIPARGNSYAIRGIAKKKKGVGLKVTGIKKRRFNPNLVKKRFWYPEENRFITLTVSTHGIRKMNKIGISGIVREMRAGGQKI